MAKKLFIIIELDQNGTISDYNIQDTLNDTDLRQISDVMKRSKCPGCFCELEYSMLVPMELQNKTNVDNFIEVENQDDIYEIIEEDVNDEEHIRDTGQEAAESENEENFASDNLTVKNPLRTSRKHKTGRIKSMKKEIKEETMETEDSNSEGGIRLSKENFSKRRGTAIKSENKVCPQCCKVFRLSSTLRVHIQRCHTPKSFCCHLCGSAFVRNKELQDHLLRHENPKVSHCLNLNISIDITFI